MDSDVPTANELPTFKKLSLKLREEAEANKKDDLDSGCSTWLYDIVQELADSVLCSDELSSIAEKCPAATEKHTESTAIDGTRLQDAMTSNDAISPISRDCSTPDTLCVPLDDASGDTISGLFPPIFDVRDNISFTTSMLEDYSVAIGPAAARESASGQKTAGMVAGPLEPTSNQYFPPNGAPTETEIKEEEADWDTTASDIDPNDPQFDFADLPEPSSVVHQAIAQPTSEPQCLPAYTLETAEKEGVDTSRDKVTGNIDEYQATDDTAARPQQEVHRDAKASFDTTTTAHILDTHLEAVTRSPEPAPFVLDHHFMTVDSPHSTSVKYHCTECRARHLDSTRTGSKYCYAFTLRRKAVKKAARKERRARKEAMRKQNGVTILATL